MKVPRIFAGLVCAFSLVACSGGGGSGSGSSEPPVNLTFTPSTLTTSQALGTTARTLTVSATASREISGVINVGIIDRTGVIEPSVTIVPQSTLTYSATVTVLSSLSAGKHTGSLEVRLCRDSPLTCSTPIPGSPWMLPYEFTILSPTAALSPSAVNLDFYQNETQSTQLTATIFNSNTIFGTGTAASVHPQFSDPTGVFAVSTTQQTGSPSSKSVAANITPKSTLAPGRYTGNLELRLCKTQTCGEQYEGSPVLIPYTFLLRPETNLTPLSRWSNIPEWSQHQGNAGHTGYVPVALDPTLFNRRWKWSLPSASAIPLGLLPAVTDNGLIYVFARDIASAGSQSGTLYAISEADKSIAWSRSFSALSGSGISLTDVGRPVTGQGQVFLNTAYLQYGLYYLHGLDGRNGNIVFQNTVPNSGGLAISNDSIVSNGWRYSIVNKTVSSWPIQSGAIGTGACNNIAALDATNSYFPTPGGLQAYSIATGMLAFAIASPAVAEYCTSLMLGSTFNGLSNMRDPSVSNGNKLVNFNMAGQSVTWSIPTSSSNTYSPAIANGTIYIVNGTQVEARAESDGRLLWSWRPDATDASPFGTFTTDGDQSSLIVTDNLLFVSSRQKVYAIRLIDREIVWTYSMPTVRNYSSPAHLSLSPNGILYIVETDQSLAHTSVTAFNVK